TGLAHQAFLAATTRLHVDDQARRDPTHAAQGKRYVRGYLDRGGVDVQRAQALSQHAQRLVIEAAADAANVAQPVAVRLGQQQRTEALATVAGRGVADDDEGFVGDVLELDPRRLPAAAIRRVGTLADD